MKYTQIVSESGYSLTCQDHYLHIPTAFTWTPASYLVQCYVYNLMYVYVINNLAAGRDFYPHFTDKKTESEQLLCPTHVSML